MNHRLIATVLGYTLCVEGFFLLLPAPVCVYFGEGDWRAFLAAAALCLLLGAALTRVPVKRRQLQGRDGYMAVALVWVVLSLFGALPYVWSGAIPNYIDALFETISGLTTTGATILNGVEQLGRGVLFWRSLTQWMGGMGVLVLFLALMPHLGGGAVHLMRAESPGPIKSKLVPKVGQTAKILYGIYIGLTLLESVALRIAGMSWYDAVNHAFTTMATGGFSVRNTSIAAYNSPLITWIITVFMFLAGTNFSLLFLLLRGRLREVLHSEELRIYTIIVVCATVFICLDLSAHSHLSFSQTFTDSAFQVVTIISTTGYATKDFALWPTTSQVVLTALMFTGACAGSTSGGIKISRITLLAKSLHREMNRLIHPNHISVIKSEGRPVAERVISSASVFFVSFILVWLAGTLVVSWDNLGFTESFTASLTCISNVGPGLGMLGPEENFSILSHVSKLVLSLLMLMGRLELMPILVLLRPSVWKER